jgi:hypothetical protein
MNTRIQHRAICFACGRQQAVDGGGYIADHGFTIDWGSRNGRCFGSRRPHFGTPGGRDLRADLAGNIARQGLDYRKRAEGIAAGTITPRLFDSRKLPIENPAPWQINQHVSALQRKAEMYLGEAQRLTVSVEQWQERFPVEVLVETRSGPLLHARGGYGALCAGSVMGGRNKIKVDDDKVTCPKCLKRLEELRAKGKR